MAPKKKTSSTQENNFPFQAKIKMTLKNICLSLKFVCLGISKEKGQRYVLIRNSITLMLETRVYFASEFSAEYQ